ncbi:hypothetical protein [Alkalihalobacterium sp. APHAB7]|uniref:hypothetical protein n=1 Tax=Alkalihalobacterium sp. APHAB7 TaxID=3402081 RepID=UPI003AAB21CA
MTNLNDIAGLFYGGFLILGIAFGGGFGIINGYFILGPLMGTVSGLGLGLLSHGIISYLLLWKIGSVETENEVAEGGEEE